MNNKGLLRRVQGCRARGGDQLLADVRIGSAKRAARRNTERVRANKDAVKQGLFDGMPLNPRAGNVVAEFTCPVIR
jgi:hypothetical protein